MLINLSGDVDYEMLNQLIKAINTLKQEETLNIYFTASSGGQVDVAEAIIDLVNENNDRVKITFYGEVFSAGMMIFFKSKCTKKLLPDTTGMYHYSWQAVNISEGGKATDAYDIFALKEMKKSKLRTLQYLTTTKLTEKEIKQIKLGKDLYISHERMLELL